MLSFVTARSIPWSSATFSGARHLFAVSLDGDGSETWLAGLPEQEFDLAYHIVADVTANGPGERAEIEMLSVAND